MAASKPGDRPDEGERSPQETALPIEVELYIQPDGSVVFADLAMEVLPVAQALNPDQPLLCDIPPSGDDPDTTEVRPRDT